MNCQQIDSILDSHGVDALSTADRAAFDCHLQDCDRCADAVRSYELLRSELPRNPEPARREQMIAVAIDSMQLQPKPTTSRRLVWSCGIAATVVVVVAAAVIADRLRSSPEPELADNAAPLAAAPDFAPVAGEFLAGLHYEYVPAQQPVPTSTGPDSIEVCEFFMFTCIHCFRLEPLLLQWAAAQSDDVALVRVPALFNETARLHARAFYTAQALGRLNSIIEPMFDEIHERGNGLTSIEQLRALFVRQGVAAAEFDSAFGSSEVEEDLRHAEELNRLYRIDSTPTLTVNGKYITGPGMAGSYEGVFDVVDALVESEVSASCETRDGIAC
jgi:protein dithiol oxidoreductase (disulfide-forming)